MTRIDLHPDSLVMLVGASGSGKSTWARRHFRDTQVVSSDRCRALVSDDEENQAANRQAFAVFYTLVRQRLSLGRLTVADSTALQPFPRHRLRGIAADHGRPVHAVVFVVPPEVLLRQNRQRARRVPDDVVLRHAAATLALVEARVLESEGYRTVHYLRPPDIAALEPRVVTPPRAAPDEPASSAGVADRGAT